MKGAGENTRRAEKPRPGEKRKVEDERVVGGGNCPCARGGEKPVEENRTERDWLAF